MSMRAIAAGMVMWCTLAPCAQAQDSTGVVDTRPGAQEQIARLEKLTSGDAGPDKMTVYLRLMGAKVPALYGPSADDQRFE